MHQSLLSWPRLGSSLSRSLPYILSRRLFDGQVILRLRCSSTFTYRSSCEHTNYVGDGALARHSTSLCTHGMDGKSVHCNPVGLSRHSSELLFIKSIKNSCEIEDFVETHLCKLAVILRSRVLLVLFGLMQDIHSCKRMTNSDVAELRDRVSVLLNILWYCT